MNVYYVGGKSLIDHEFQNATIEECYEYLKTCSIVGLDIETTQKYGGRYKNEGLDPYLSKIVMLQIGDENRQYIIDYRVIDITPILPILTSNSIVKVGHNIKFEYKHIFHNEGIRLENVYDTMIVEKILFNGISKEFTLDSLNQKYLGIKVNKDTRLEFLHIKDRPFTTRQINYGAEDILHPLLIRKKQLLDAKQKDVLNCINLEHLFLLVLGDIEYKGMKFNQAKWLTNYDANKIEFDRKISELDNYVVFNYQDTKFVSKQLDLFSTELKCKIKWTSSKQVIEFFRYLEICPEDSKKKSGYTVDAKTVKASLNTINRDKPDEIKDFIKLYLSFKEKEQACTTFGKDFLKHVNPVTNRVHSNYNQIINTGRMSSSGPNLQNIPAEEGFRGAFDCSKGWNIINADYSGQEQIILANKSNDKDLIYFYEQNLGDMHSFVASKIFPELNGLSLKEVKNKHKDKRQIAKSAGFAINYGGDGYTISKNLGIPEPEGRAVYDAYFKAFPGLNDYFRKMKATALRRGYILIDPLTGRKFWFEKPKTSKDKGSVERTALNYPIQGEAGGITKLAPVLFRKWILENNLQDSVFITNIVHDEINLEVKSEFAEIAAKNLELCMQKAGDKWCRTVKLTADAVITNYWNH